MGLLFEWDENKAKMNLQIRIISVRRATRRGRRTYEKGT